MTAEIVRLEKYRRFVEAMTDAIDGKPLSPMQRNLLSRVLDALSDGKDVADLIGTTPANGRPPVDHTMPAIHYHALRAAGEKSVVALRVVADAWAVSTETVKQAARLHRSLAEETIGIYGTSLGDLIQHCRNVAGVRKSR